MTSYCLSSIGVPVISPKAVAIELPRFSGSNPEEWILQVERYFQFYSIADAYKLSLASFYLDGDALEWFRWPYRNDQFYDWKHFTEKLLLRFQKPSCCAPFSATNTFISAWEYGSARQMFDTTSQRAALDEIMAGLAEISERMKCFIDATSTKSTVFDKLAEKSIDVDSLARDSNGNNGAIDILDNMETYKVEIENPVEVVELVEDSSIVPDDHTHNMEAVDSAQEVSAIAQGQVFNVGSVLCATKLLDPKQPLTLMKSAPEDRKSEDLSNVKVQVDGSEIVVQHELDATSLFKEVTNAKNELVPEAFCAFLQHLALVCCHLLKCICRSSTHYRESILFSFY